MSTDAIQMESLDGLGLRQRVDLPLQHLGSEQARSRPAVDVPAQQHPGDEHARTGFTASRLQSARLFVVVRVYNASAFLGATAVVAAFSTNAFLSEVLELGADIAGQEGVADAGVDDCFRVVGLIAHACFFAFACMGLIQRGDWLVRDSLEPDMFISYRRTLCCEGSGPGAFQGQRRKVLLNSTVDADDVQGALGQDRVLVRDLEVNGVRVPRGAELLGLTGVADIELPATVTFGISTRLLGSSKIHTAADASLQCLLPITLGVVPAIFACFVKLDSWLQTFVVTAVFVSINHIALYFICSTVLEYYWKLKAIWSSFSPASSSRSARTILEEDADSFLGGPLLAAHGPRPRASPSGSLSFAAPLGGMLARRTCGWALAICIAGCLGLCLILGVRCQAGKLTLAAGILCVLLAYVHLHLNDCYAGRHGLRAHSAAGHWAPWFRVACSVEPARGLRGALGMLCASLSLAAAGIWHGALGFTLLASALAAWSVHLLLVCARSPDHLWKFCLVNGAGASLAALAMSMSARGLWRGGGRCLLLILLSQAGMWRQRQARPHAAMLAALAVVVPATAVVSLAANLTGTGFAVGDPPLPMYLQWVAAAPRAGASACPGGLQH